MEVPDAITLLNLASMTQVGTEVRITVLREGKKQDVTVRTADMKQAAKALEASAGERLGAQFRNLTSQERAKYDLEPEEGIVVTSVEPKGPLGRAGFEPGDLILQINDRTVDGVDSFAQLVSMLPSHKQVTLLAADPNREVAGMVKVALR
jgi:serine protease Do